MKSHDMIKEAKLNDIIIWFDEAHHGGKGLNRQSISFLLKDECIPHRVPPATLDKVVDLNPDVFGELYKR